MVSADDRFDALVKPWKPRQQKAYKFKNANLIDPVDGVVHQGVTVCLADGLVQSIAEEQSEKHSIPEDMTTIDLQGKYLCPGLFDCHVHLTAPPGEAQWKDLREVDETVCTLRQSYVCQQMLHRGFTTLRDTGGAGIALKQALEEGLIHGPRLFIAGSFISQTGGHGDFRSIHDREHASEPGCCGHNKGMMGYICDGVPECLRAAREAIRTGSDFLKIMTGGGVASPTDSLDSVQFTAEEIQAVTTVAKNSGTYVTAHAYTPRAIRLAMENGVMGIEHGNMLDKETAELMAAKGAFLTPTLICNSAHGDPNLPSFFPKESIAKNTYVLERGLQCLQVAHEAGVTMCYGSDLLGHLIFAQNDEFALRAKVLPALSILQSATINAARMCGQPEFLGQIKPGFAADMLILNANPLEDITVLAKPQDHVLSVIKEGRVYMSRWSGLKEDVTPQIANLE